MKHILKSLHYQLKTLILEFLKTNFSKEKRKPFRNYKNLSPNSQHNPNADIFILISQLAHSKKIHSLKMTVIVTDVARKLGF